MKDQKNQVNRGTLQHIVHWHWRGNSKLFLQQTASAACSDTGVYLNILSKKLNKVIHTPSGQEIHRHAQYVVILSPRDKKRDLYGT